MAGQVHTGGYPSAYNWETNPPPHIQGFTPQEDWNYAHPEPPKGYDNWTDYIKEVVQAGKRGEEGPRPLDRWGGNILQEDVSPMTWLINSYGYGRLAPLVDTNDPDIQSFLDNTYYSNTSHDSQNIFGDQFFGALMGLGLATGGAAAMGAFTPAAAGAGGAAAGAGAGAGSAVAGAAPELLAAGGLVNASAPVLAGAGSAAGAGVGAATASGLLGSLGWMPLVGAGISGLTSLIGGIQGANAAKDAARTQAESAREANKLLSDMYAQQRSDLEPYRMLGYASLGDMLQRAGVRTERVPFSLGNYTGAGAPRRSA